MLRIIDAFSRVSRLRAMHPMEKLLLCILPVIILNFSKDALPLLLNIGFLLILNIIIKNPMKYVVKFSAAIVGFSILSSIPLYFDYGISYCSIVLLKALSGALSISMLSFTTPVEDILLVFSRYKSLRNLCDIIKSMKRFLFILEEEYVHHQRAMKCRAVSEGLSSRIRSSGKTVSLLFISTMRKWEDIKNAINSRGYRGHMSYIAEEYSFSKRRLVYVVFYNLIIALAVAFMNL